MEQLLKITTVPVQYELKINNARLEYSRSNAQVEILLFLYSYQLLQKTFQCL